jgi:hypothetical protein
MKIDRFFVDTNIPMFAGGKEHDYKELCTTVLESIANGKIFAFTDVEVFQEILYRFTSQQKPKLGIQIFNDFLKIMEGTILPITLKEIKELRKLTEKYPQAKSRDLMHLSVMLSNGISKIITADKDFDRFEEAEVVHPKTFLIHPN